MNELGRTPVMRARSSKPYRIAKYIIMKREELPTSYVTHAKGNGNLSAIKKLRKNHEKQKIITPITTLFQKRGRGRICHVRYRQ